VISFYSDLEGSNYYSKCAERLKQQLTTLGIPFDIREKISLGSYQKNCLSKPDYILKLLTIKQKPIVWLDIDSDVRKSLGVFDIFKGNADIVFAASHPKLHAIKASPIYFDFNSKTLDFLQHWKFMANNLASTGKWFDHEALVGIAHNFYTNKQVNMKFLGPEYCVWPGHEDANSVIIMGLADVESKKNALKELGMSEELIAWQSPGLR
jgi:hypothetical protein